MSPINTLKKGLTRLQDQIREQKGKLKAALKAGQPISETDLAWLSNDVNLIDEESVIKTLEGAFDYESAFEKLDFHEKIIVEKSKKLAEGGEKSVAPAKKCKCRDLHKFFFTVHGAPSSAFALITRSSTRQV